MEHQRRARVDVDRLIPILQTTERFLSADRSPISLRLVRSLEEARSEDSGLFDCYDCYIGQVRDRRDDPFDQFWRSE